MYPHETMSCPKCGSPLAVQIIGEVEVDQCPACHGIWLDLGELPALLEKRPIPDGNGRAPAILSDVIQGCCPRCQGLGNMTRLTSIKRPDIVMDSCPVCYGIWLDGGELGKLAEKSLRVSIRTIIRDLLTV